jgi:hypothetical protein
VAKPYPTAHHPKHIHNDRRFLDFSAFKTVGSLPRLSSVGAGGRHAQKCAAMFAICSAIIQCMSGSVPRTGPAAKFFLYESTDNVAVGCCTFDYNIQRFAS